LKLDGHAYSPAILLKMVETAAHIKAFDVAARLLQRTAEFSISGRHLNRIVTQIGTEMRAARDQRTEDYVHHRRRPLAEPAPQKVALGVDGGRLNTRQPGHGGGVQEPGWREDKVGCLQVLEGPVFTTDPHPEPPQCFADKDHVKQLVKDCQQHKGLRCYDEPETPVPAEAGRADRDGLPDALDAPPAAAEALGQKPGPGATTALPAAVAPGAEQPPVSAATAGAVASPAWPPQRLARTCVASLGTSRVFGKLLAAEAYARGFFAADLRAFLGDGLAYNWKMQQQWFPDFLAILDFIHPLSYLYAAAGVLSSDEAQRWSLYVRWMTTSWQGEVQKVVAELRQGQARLEEQLGQAEGKMAASDPREVLRKAINYLENNASRMDYPRYRRLGLPVTSAAVESLIKEVNYRVKGSEKFWNDPEGAEAILQVRAAVLSEDDRLAAHIHNRPGHAYRRRSPAKRRDKRPAA
jgi:hypothetical protein